MPDTYSNAGAIWALGITQIVGYDTLYYSFSIVAPHIALEFDVALEWIYGCISLALFAGGLISPWAGGLADRHGAGRVMSLGSIGAAAALAICGFAGNTIIFLSGMILVELASAFVLYSTAFAFLAQTTGSQAQRSITYLTLIAGFASTIFWPSQAGCLEALTGIKSTLFSLPSTWPFACRCTFGCRGLPELPLPVRWKRSHQRRW